MAKDKKKEPIVDPGPLEHDGWKLGQEVWCLRFPSGDLACGPITKINLAGSEPCFTFLDKFNSSFRLALFSSIIPVPTAAMWKTLDRVLAREKMKGDRADDKRLAKAKGK